MRLLLYAYTDTEISDVYDLLDTLDAKQFATNIEKASLAAIEMEKDPSKGKVKVYRIAVQEV